MATDWTREKIEHRLLELGLTNALVNHGIHSARQLGWSTDTLLMGLVEVLVSENESLRKSLISAAMRAVPPGWDAVPPAKRVPDGG